MSVAPSPAALPLGSVPRPEVVLPKPKKPSNNGLWVGLIVAIVMLIGAGLFWRRTSQVASAPLMTDAVRTAKVGPGTVETTIRVSGVTAAENFASLITPRLSGSRSDRLRDGTGTGSTSSVSGATASATASNSSSSSATAGAGPVSSGASNATSAFQSATSRFGGTLRGSSSSAQSSASANTPAASSAMGSGGLGTAADSLGGGGGGGNGPGDFSLVLQRAVPAGSPVHKGDVVAEFDRQYMLLRLDDYNASVVQSAASLTKQKAELDITQHAHEQLISSAKADLDKARLDLKTVPVLSEIDAERAKLAVDQAEARYKQLLNEVNFVKISQEADIRNASLDLEQSRIELKRAQANTDKMIVRAPMDGVVVMQTTFRGSELGQIQQGDQLWPGMFFMQVVNPASMVISATVNQVDCEKLRMGSKARIRFDAYPGLTLPGHVMSIGAVTKPAGSRPNYVKEVPIRLKVDVMDRKVIPDLTVSAEILVDAPERSEAVIPLGAVFKAGSPSKTYVFVEKSSGWESREVELGATNNVAAVVRKGLRAGDIVAIDHSRPTDGKGTQRN